MRVLWVSNVVFPCAAEKLGLTVSASGGWMYDFAESLAHRDGISLGVAAAYTGREFRALRIHDIDFYLIPVSGAGFLLGTKKAAPYIRLTVQAFCPDILHIHGAEMPLGLQFIRLYPKLPAVLNIQTLLGEVRREQFAGMCFSDILRSFTPREFLALKSPLMRKCYAAIREKRERQYLRSVRFVIGSTRWDRAFLACGPFNGTYFHCPYLFRKEFYNPEYRWDLQHMERHSVLTGQAAEPLKGLHVLLEAVYYVKREIPDIRLYIPGPDLLSKRFQSLYGYARYIGRLIRRLSLTETVVFTGQLDASSMARRMQNANVVVVSSAVELGSSTLCEAMLLGVPMIASFRGGMTETFQHGQSGFYYDFSQKYLLADYIKSVLLDDSLAQKFSQNVRVAALHGHSEETCTGALLEAYHKMLPDAPE